MRHTPDTLRPPGPSTVTPSVNERPIGVAAHARRDRLRLTSEPKVYGYVVSSAMATPSSRKCTFRTLPRALASRTTPSKRLRIVTSVEDYGRDRITASSCTSMIEAGEGYVAWGGGAFGEEGAEGMRVVHRGGRGRRRRWGRRATRGAAARKERGGDARRQGAVGKLAWLWERGRREQGAGKRSSNYKIQIKQTNGTKYVCQGDQRQCQCEETKRLHRESILTTSTGTLHSRAAYLMPTNGTASHVP